MKHRLAPAAVAATATIGAALISAFADSSWPGALLLATAGAPITVLLLVRGLLGDVERSVIPSLLIGGIGVPILVVALHGVFAAAAIALVEPLLEGVRGFADQIRVDGDLLGALTSGWALVMIVEYAVVAPLAEETLKPLGSVLRKPASRAEALLFGVAAGTGFAIVENLMYATDWFLWWDGWLPISLMRMPGAALHAFGAGLVSLGLYEARHQAAQRRSLGSRYAMAFGAHALWNGAIAVTIVLFSEQGLAGSDTAAIAWGASLMILLTAVGAIVLAGLVSVTRAVARGDRGDPLPVGVLNRPSGVAAWSLATAAVVIPTAILIAVFPGFVAL